MLNLYVKTSDLIALSSNTTATVRELEILLVEALGISPTKLKTEQLIAIDLATANKLNEFLKQLKAKFPLGYIINKASFWDLDLWINSNVLIPRSATELLVEKALELIPPGSAYKILELGTGSGAIALALAKHRPYAKIIATDVCLQALEVAAINAVKLKLNNIKLQHSDWFKHAYFATYPKFDLIISNPPYIAATEHEICDPGIFFEPKIALFSADNGLSDLHHIISHSLKYLTPQGILLLEHGFSQKVAVINKLMELGFTKIKSFQDLEGLDRVVIGFR